MTDATDTATDAPIGSYPFVVEIPSRFGDNDMLGHFNNVTYNRFIETVVVHFQTDEVGVDWADDPVVPMAVEALCRFHRPLSYPERVRAGLRVARIGNSSVTFAIALFGMADDDRPAATGHFVHVYTNRQTGRPEAMAPARRAVYERFR